MPNIFMVLNTAPRGTALSRTDQKGKKILSLIEFML